MSSSRSAFAAKFGAMCVNPQFAWSYINEVEKFILFGAWEHEKSSDRCLIFSERWQRNISGRKNNGYGQSSKHINKIVGEGFNLMTFSMVAVDTNPIGPTKVKSFSEEIFPKKLVKVGGDYFAVEPNIEDITDQEGILRQYYWEGAKTEVLQNVYERSPEARKACLETHGYACSVCNFDFEKSFGDFAKGYIHVHHLVRMADRPKPFVIDGSKEMVPVCPNCHAMIHKKIPPFSIEEMKAKINEAYKNK